MTASSDAPSPFNNDEWVRYNNHRIAAVMYVWLGTITVLAGFAYGMGGITLPSTDLATLSIDGTQIIVSWAVVTAGILVARLSVERWTRARLVRTSAEAKAQAGVMFSTILATTILKTLKAAASEDRNVSHTGGEE